MNRPAIDHSVLSPSGRVSNRARQAASGRLASELFPPGYWNKPQPTARELETQHAQQMLDQAKRLRELAACRRKYPKAADMLEQKAAAILARREPK